MNFVALACCLTLLAYGTAMSAASLLSCPLLPAALLTPEPDSRSRRLFALRVLPVAFAFFVALEVVLPAFVWFEPWDTGERVALGLLVGAVFSSAVLATGIVRVGSGLLATKRLVRRWLRGACPIRLVGVTMPVYAVDEPFPIVTIAGCVHPRLFVSRIVLEHCTGAELAAIVAHEAGHQRRGDAWRRLVLRACPDILALTPIGAALERWWAEAADEAADDCATAAGDAPSLDLASALLKVARLAGNARPRGLPLTALYHGGGAAGRAARLLGRLSPPVVPPRGKPGTVAAIALAVGVLFVPLAAVSTILHQVHNLLESVVLLFG
ncbi:MAG: hypothetical protein LAO51_04420 [Acidobacteriia bacterium]|nr:hypothetical protein [Terriglobia bacterium]